MLTRQETYTKVVLLDNLLRTVESTRKVQFPMASNNKLHTTQMIMSLNNLLLYTWIDI